MTLEQFILNRSYLPQNGTYTMTDHIMAMMMYVQGVEAKLEILDVASEIIIDDIKESTMLTDITERIEEETEVEEIELEDNIEETEE